MRILAISDEKENVLYEESKRIRLGKINLVISCGDLSSDYLSYVSTVYGAPLFMVRGNHDREIDLGGLLWGKSAPATGEIPGLQVPGI